MTREIPTKEPPKPLEILGLLFTFVTTAGEIPKLLRKTGITSWLPDCLKQFLLDFHPYPDFYLIGAYAVSMAIVWRWISNAREIVFVRDEVGSRLHAIFQTDDELAESVTLDDTDSMARFFQRSNFRDNVRSLGLAPIRRFLVNRVLDPLGIAIYDGFDRPRPWPERPEYFDRVIRLNYADGIGAEIQFKRDYSAISVREHPQNSNNYGDPIDRPPRAADVKVMLVDSWFTRRWLATYWIKSLW